MCSPGLAYGGAEISSRSLRHEHMPILSRIPSFSLGPLGRNTLISTLGLAARAVIQAVYLILVSRALGSAGYGLFAGSIAAAVVLGPLSGWGASYVFSRHVSRAPDRAPSLWAETLCQIALTGSLLTLVLLVLSAWFLPESLNGRAMLGMAISELLALPMAQAATRALMTKHRADMAAITMCIVPIGRLLFVAGYIWASTDGVRPTSIVLWHLLGSFVGALAAAQMMRLADMAPVWRDRQAKRLLALAHEGTPYAMGALVGLSYMEIDKVLLLQLLGPEVTGTYGVAFRAVSIFLLPMAALVGATMPRLFSITARHDWGRMMNAVMRAALMYGIAATVACLAGAKLVPIVFGKDYALSSSLMLALSPMVLLYALHQAAGVGLTCAGRQKQRVMIEAVGLSIIVVVNLMFLRVWGVTAAVLAILIAEAWMAAACWWRLKRKAVAGG